MVYFFVCYHCSRTAFCSELWYWVVIIYVFLVIPNPTVPIHHWSFLLHDEKIASIIGITWELHEVVHNVIPRRNNHLLCSANLKRAGFLWIDRLGNFLPKYFGTDCYSKQAGRWSLSHCSLPVMPEKFWQARYDNKNQLGGQRYTYIPRYFFPPRAMTIINPRLSNNHILPKHTPARFVNVLVMQ